MNGMQDYETMERWLGSKGSIDSLDTELAGLHEEEFWNWLICNYKRFVADCKSYDISSTLQMSNSGFFSFSTMNRLFRILLAILLIFSGKVFSQSFSFTSATNELKLPTARPDMAWQSCVTDNEGNTYLSSNFTDSVTIGDSVIYKNFPIPASRVWLAKLRPNGEIAWLKVEERTLSEVLTFTKIKLDRNGDIILLCNKANAFEPDSVQLPWIGINNFMTII